MLEMNKIILHKFTITKDTEYPMEIISLFIDYLREEFVDVDIKFEFKDVGDLLSITFFYYEEE